ncbi:hypothetical protein GJ904_20080 [Salmonella enterica]|nr:hypothetical protein [Salmonella enterica subsp. enterica serovar Saintpaul]EEC1303364.1 hypothetical protein [Salmonella enterica]
MKRTKIAAIVLATVSAFTATSVLAAIPSPVVLNIKLSNTYSDAVQAYLKGMPGKTQAEAEAAVQAIAKNQNLNLQGMPSVTTPSANTPAPAATPAPTTGRYAGAYGIIDNNSAPEGNRYDAAQDGAIDAVSSAANKAIDDTRVVEQAVKQNKNSISNIQQHQQYQDQQFATHTIDLSNKVDKTTYANDQQKQAQADHNQDSWIGAVQKKADDNKLLINAQDGKIDANKQAVDSLAASVTGHEKGIKDNAAAIQKNTSDIATKVSQADFIADQARQDKALTDAVDKQAQTDHNQDSWIGAVQKKADDNKQLITKNAQGVTDAKASVSALDTRVTAHDKGIKDNTAAISNKLDKTTYAADQASVLLAEKNEHDARVAADDSLDARVTTAQDTANTALHAAGDAHSLAQTAEGIAVGARDTANENKQKIADAVTDIDTNKQGIQDNKTAIAAKVDTTAYTVDQKRQDDALTTETDRATQAEKANAADISTNKDGIASNKTAIASKANQSDFVVLQSSVDQKVNTGDFQQRAADVDARIAENKANQIKTDKIVADHTNELADHEDRIQKLESNNSANFGKLKQQVEANRKRASAGIAGVAAQANIPQVLESQTFNIGAGVGNTDGESALAVGFSARASQNVVVKAAVSNDTQHNFVVGAGVAVGW